MRCWSSQQNKCVYRRVKKKQNEVNMERPSSTCYLAVVFYFGFISLLLSGMFALIISVFPWNQLSFCLSTLWREQTWGELMTFVIILASVKPLGTCHGLSTLQQYRIKNLIDSYYFRCILLTSIMMFIFNLFLSNYHNRWRNLVMFVVMGLVYGIFVNFTHYPPKFILYGS